MASVKTVSAGYSIWITNIRTATIIKKMTMGQGFISNMNWLSESRISYEQYGILRAINIDGTENQQLMSIFKNEKKKYYSYKNIQSSKMLNVLKNDFEHILIETRGLDNFPIITKLNIFTGEKEEIENGEDKEITDWLVDRSGNVRLGRKYEDDKVIFYTKNGKNQWESKNKLKLDMSGGSLINQKLNLIDFDYNKNILYLSSSVKSERWQVLSYDMSSNEYIDTILTDSKYDIGSPLEDNTQLLFLNSEKKLAGIRYFRDKPYTKWFSKRLQSRQDSLDLAYKKYYCEIFDWNSDASVVLARLYNDISPGHLVIYDSNHNKMLRYTTYAKKLFQYKRSKTKTISYKTRDSYEIEGYLNLPVSTEKKVPLIVMPHGGPWARDHWEYNPIVQFFSNRGFGVLRMNFRGSTGYGTKHLLAGVKKISTTMVNDIVDATKWAIQDSIADKNNIFLYGHSYGGYATLQSITKYPDLFSAGISIGAPTDLEELLDYYDDIENEFNYEFWKKNVEDPDDDDYLESVSPIHNISKITKPVMFFHGEKDRIVPVSQTNDFIDEAKEINKTFEVKIIKNEDHSISENRNTEYLLRKSLQFYKKNLTKNIVLTVPTK